ncbi:aldo/keto reductase [Pollutimonas bauzanensis]|uniref:Aldo/keto reductase n=1 Tax=Pollutimonas bauzanensis TaxID=658167 RepID=A0A1M5Z9D6_9BURK|nr:aldo/keto reductase [Pollutimonas bauzanensis]SHI20824.1 Aldo/keto reductase [Pollutimonas bauzanensis]
MRQHQFGNTGRSIAAIGQGSWYIDAARRGLAVSAIRRGLDLGMRHIDTAEMYGSGAAESVVGEAIRGRRDDVFLVSKVLPENASRHGTRAACERSLKQLGTDHLDCYLLHWRGAHPLEETFAAFEDLQDQGKILSFGVSNFDVDDLEEAWAVAGPGRLACNQVLYHLKERAIEHAVIPWCERHEVAVVAYSPFGHDDFPGPKTAGGRALGDIALAHDASPRQIALAFLTRKPALFAIPKAAQAAHAEENAAAGAIDLSDQEIHLLDEAFPRGPQPRFLPVI